MKWLESKHDKLKYFVTDETFNKMKNYRNIKLHDVLEQKNGYNFVFSYKFFDDFGEKATGYKTVWQDRHPDEFEFLLSDILGFDHRVPRSTEIESLSVS